METTLPTVLVVGPVNFVLYRVCYATYGEEYAFFVSQGVNLLYVVYGGAILLPKMWFGDEITPAMRALPQPRFDDAAYDAQLRPRPRPPPSDAQPRCRQAIPPISVVKP